jgi:hypothetical protein
MLIESGGTSVAQQRDFATVSQWKLTPDATWMKAPEEKLVGAPGLEPPAGQKPPNRRVTKKHHGQNFAS